MKDGDESRISSLLYRFLLILAAMNVILVIVLPLVHGPRGRFWIVVVLIAPMWMAGIPLLARGKLKAVEYTLSAYMWLCLTGVSFISGGVRSPILVGYFSVIVTVAVTLGGAFAVGAALSASMVILTIHFLQSGGHLPEAILVSSDLSAWVVITMNLLLVSIFIGLSTKGTRESLSRLKAGRFEIEEREHYLEAVLESAPDAIITTDSGNRVVEWNRGAERLFGYSAAEAAGADLDSLVAGDDYREEAEHLSHIVLEGKAVKPIETVRRTRDDAAVEVVAGGSAIILDGKVAGTVAVYTNITGRRRSERLLSSLNRAGLVTAGDNREDEIFGHIASILAESGYPGLILTVEDDGTIRPMFLGYDRETISFIKSITGKSRNEVAFPVERVSEIGEIVRERKTIYISDVADFAGRLFDEGREGVPVNIFDIFGMDGIIGAPIPVEDRVIGILALRFIDPSPSDLTAVSSFALQIGGAVQKTRLMRNLEESLSYLRETQDQLIQAQKMEAVGRLAGGIAHDFNNILTAISGYTELLIADAGEMSAAGKDLVEIRKAAERAASLTGQLLAFSRKQVLRAVTLDLNSVLHDMDQLLRRLIGENIELVIETAGNCVLVRADPGQLQQVILNLALNARDAMPDGGILTLGTSVGRFDDAHPSPDNLPPGRFVVLTVSDTGMGMDDTTMKRLFEPFFTTRAARGGTGLGLSTVHGIVLQSGGGITVESGKGIGSVFSVYLPETTDTAEREDTQPQRKTRHVNRGTILLVEDETTVRTLAQRILERAGYTVLSARDAPDALEILEKESATIDLLLTDVVMPGGMNGRTLAKTIAASHIELRILYISGYAEDAFGTHEVSEPGEGFLRKPFTPGELLTAVSGVLGGTEGG